MPNRDFLRLPDVYVEVPSGAPFPGTGSLAGASLAGIAEAENLIQEHLNEIRRAWSTHFPS
jgi:hypothetical protein